MGPIQMMKAHASGSLDFTGVGGKAEQAVYGARPGRGAGSAIRVLSEFAETLANGGGSFQAQHLHSLGGGRSLIQFIGGRWNGEADGRA